MTLLKLLESGRSLAERIPYSVIALMSRFAVAGVFWRSGQTKVSGFSIREETFFLFREEYKVPLLPPDLAAYLSTIAEHVFPILLVVGFASRLSALGLVRHDDGDPALCLSLRLARAHTVAVDPAVDHRARSRGDFAGSSGLEPGKLRFGLGQIGRSLNIMAGLSAQLGPIPHKSWTRHPEVPGEAGPRRMASPDVAISGPSPFEARCARASR